MSFAYYKANLFFQSHTGLIGTNSTKLRNFLEMNECLTPHNNNKTILIIEDDPFIAMDLEDTFTDSGYEVIGPYADVKSGLRALATSPPDVAMLDYNLGSETSIPIAKALQDREIPYVFLSGQVERVVIGHDLPARPVIAKPFVPNHLVRLVNDLAL